MSTDTTIPLARLLLRRCAAVVAVAAIGSAARTDRHASSTITPGGRS